jgi:hypothetical protein
VARGVEVVSPKRGAAHTHTHIHTRGPPSPSRLDTIHKNAALKQQLAQARSEISRFDLF